MTRARLRLRRRQSGRDGRRCRDAVDVTGVAGTLFTAGADGLKSVTFTTYTALKAIYKDATGLAAQETLNYGTTTAASGHTILTATGATSCQTVFTLDVGSDGSYTFTQRARDGVTDDWYDEESLPVVIWLHGDGRRRRHGDGVADGERQRRHADCEHGDDHDGDGR